MKQALTVALVAAIAAGGSITAQAYQAGDWVLRAGATTVDPDASSDKIDLGVEGVPVLEADVDDDTQLGIIPVWMVTDNFGLELLLATPFKHDISLSGTGISLDAGETKQLPPTLSLQWYPRGGQDGWQPYIGIGLNYTTFFSEDTTTELDDTLGAILGATKVDLELDDSFGLAAQVGVDIPFAENWAFNLGVWYIDIETTAKVKTDVGTVKFDVDIDPWVYNVGIAYKF